MPDQKIDLWPPSRFLPYGHNPRKNDHVVDRMAASIREFGFKVPMLARSDGEVVDGHLRLKAALELGLAEIPTILCDEWTPAQVKAFRIMVNKSVEWADWDAELLNVELGDLKDLNYDLTLTGFDLSEVDGLLQRSWTPPARESQKPAAAPAPAEPEAPAEGLTADDATPAEPPAPVTTLGDLWLLGDHRVLCGDCTLAETTARLWSDRKPDLCITDPPYGIGVVIANKDSDEKYGIVGRGGSGAGMYPYGGLKAAGITGTIGDAKARGDSKGSIGDAQVVRPKQYPQVINDHSTETAQRFYERALAAGLENIILFGGNYFTAFLPPSPCWLVWDKQNSGDFADVEIAWSSFDRPSKLYSWLWNGMSREGDRKTELVTRVHPTQKPVGLFLKIFADFPFEVAYDGFLGSGSTLIACEKLSRPCFGMELSPAYVDVIVTRWQNFTGKKATLEADGRTFDEIREHRLAEQAAA